MKNQVITYTVNKTNDSVLYISVQNGEVLVRAPWYTTQNKIQEIVANKREWIIKKLTEYEEKKEEKISLRPIQILGITYSLKVLYKNVNVIQCDLENNVVKICLPKKYKKISKESMTDILIDKLYTKICERELDNIMDKSRTLTGIAPEDYKIMDMNDCIAKCTQDKIIIVNPRIIKYKREVVEYIIMHEFCHLKYKNHTKSFYNMLSKYIPNYSKFEIENMKY